MAFWALKTGQTNGGEEVLPEDYWEQFLEKKIIAIGWGEIDASPEIGKEEIREALKIRYNYGDRQAIPAALTIYNFIHLNLRDRILLCRGNSYSFGKNVRLLGVARITGPVFKGYLGKWPVFQHNADVEDFAEDRREIKKDELTDMLKKGLLHGKPHGGSLALTLQEITREAYEAVVSWADHQPQ